MKLPHNKGILPIFIFLSFFVVKTQAQSIGLGLHLNHISNGINVSYNIDSKNQKWEHSLGLRVHINGWDRAENEGNAYYQQGASYTFFENFSLNYTAYRRLYRHKIFDIGLMTNVHLAFQSIVSDPEIGWDSSADTSFLSQTYIKASPSLELTIGPKFHIKLSDKIRLYGMAGFGATYMHHIFQGKNLITGRDVYIYIFPKSDRVFRNRGYYELSFFAGVGIKYNITKK